MTTDRLRFEIKLRWNKLNSNHKKDFYDSYLDDILNNAVHDYVEMFYTGSNPNKYNIGFEVTQQRIDMLSTLVVPSQTVVGVLVEPNVYKFDLSTLDPAYKHFLRGSVIVESCDNLKIPITIVRHNDLDVKLISENTKPSLKWKRCLGTFKQEGTGTALYIYTDSNFTATTFELEYLRKPAKIFSGTYDTLEYTYGDLTAPSNGDPAIQCDLPEDYHTILVEIAVQIIARILQDPNTLTLSEDKLLKTT